MLCARGPLGPGPSPAQGAPGSGCLLKCRPVFHTPPTHYPRTAPAGKGVKNDFKKVAKSGTQIGPQNWTTQGVGPSPPGRPAQGVRPSPPGQPAQGVRPHPLGPDTFPSKKGVTTQGVRPHPLGRSAAPLGPLGRGGWAVQFGAPIWAQFGAPIWGQFGAPNWGRFGIDFGIPRAYPWRAEVGGRLRCLGVSNPDPRYVPARMRKNNLGAVVMLSPLPGLRIFRFGSRCSFGPTSGAITGAQRKASGCGA